MLHSKLLNHLTLQCTEMMCVKKKFVDAKDKRQTARCVSTWDWGCWLQMQISFSIWSNSRLSYLQPTLWVQPILRWRHIAPKILFLDGSCTEGHIAPKTIQAKGHIAAVHMGILHQKLFKQRPYSSCSAYYTTQSCSFLFQFTTWNVVTLALRLT